MIKKVSGKQVPGVRSQVSGRKFQHLAFFSNLKPITYNLPRGFTLVETLVAISLLTIAVVAPMSLTTQSLSSAYYARDQMTAFHLAQEAIESMRHIRDGNVLKNALGTQTDLLAPIPTDGSRFTVDTRNDGIQACPSLPLGCPPLKTDGELYGYGTENYWTTTKFTRSVTAEFVRNEDGSDNRDEVHVTVTVSWQTAGIQRRSFTISENMYRWVNDGSAAR